MGEYFSHHQQPDYTNSHYHTSLFLAPPLSLFTISSNSLICASFSLICALTKLRYDTIIVREIQIFILTLPTSPIYHTDLAETRIDIVEFTQHFRKRTCTD